MLNGKQFQKSSSSGKSRKSSSSVPTELPVNYQDDVDDESASSEEVSLCVLVSDRLSSRGVRPALCY